ncbi:MAG: family 2 encapsulin nanocompartment cargo protein polyprenyl transferase [Anaerolineales bacterium]
MSLKQLSSEMLPAIEAELQRQAARLDEKHTQSFHQMLTYHMGWTGEGAGPGATGKRIRPLMLLLVAAGCENKWLHAISGAAAIELVHNFSLVHDDIQDNSEKRRGRPTAWTIWGAPMAINLGDALFVISNQAIMDLQAHYPAETVVKAASVLHNTCLDLTRGQFLDMAYEERTDVSVEDYWPMIAGKTASLLSAACYIGAILGGADEATQDAYRSFGHALGLAFQVQDDILGIWGDEAVTGKSAASDLLEGKKSLPVLFGLSKNGPFRERWLAGPIQADEVEQVARMLANEGAYEQTYALSEQMTLMALNNLREADPKGPAGDALMELANKLLKREQ